MGTDKIIDLKILPYGMNHPHWRLAAPLPDPGVKDLDGRLPRVPRPRGKSESAARQSDFRGTEISSTLVWHLSAARRSKGPPCEGEGRRWASSRENRNEKHLFLADSTKNMRAEKGFPRLLC
jgi:hypothetical protein